MFDGMRLKISRGNSKIGKIPNLSLPPIITCRDKAPCANDCYAMKAYRQYPTARTAWNGNLELYQQAPYKFFGELCLYLAVETPERFRLFVGGDFLDEEFYLRMLDVVASYPATSFLCFTKRYEFVMDDASTIPSNIKIVLSMWPGLEIPEFAKGYPSAWLSDDPRFNDYYENEPYIVCPGRCDDCGYQCWHAVSAELPVVFHKH